ncbi:MAG: riboflavin synthase [Chitinophagaceae bacterium]
MFTGIIETLAEITDIQTQGTNKIFWLASPLASDFKVDQSIAHNGVCLTVEELNGEHYRVTAVRETLLKTAINNWKVGHFVNLERSLMPGSRLDGHFVQGHVDGIGRCKKIKDKEGSKEITFEFSKRFAPLMIEKGSISVNGISLTAFNVKKDSFKVAIIPYTWQYTNLQYLKEGDEVNLEFDMIGKYIVSKLKHIAQ